MAGNYTGLPPEFLQTKPVQINISRKAEPALEYQEQSASQVRAKLQQQRPDEGS